MRALTASLIAILVLSASPAAAASVRLGWRLVQGSAGYRIYVREPAHAYGSGSDVGPIAADSDGIVYAVVSGVSLDVPHYFAVTSYDTDDLESSLSNELLLKKPLLCPALPAAGCRPPAPEGALLSVRNVAGTTQDRLQWKWTDGDTSVGNLGDPLGDTSYVLCIYDDSNGLSHVALNVPIPAGGQCGNRPCWHDLGRRGFGYLDRSRGAFGQLKMKLREGARTATIQVQAKGANLTLPAPAGTALFQQDPAVTVQLLNDALPSACWEAAFSAAARANTAKRFKDASD